LSFEEQLAASQALIAQLREQALASAEQEDALKAKAQEALFGALMSQDESEPRRKAEEPVDFSRGWSTLVGDEQPTGAEEAVDLEDAKAKARSAIASAFSLDEEDDIEEAKAKARAALSSAFSNEAEDIEALKGVARDSLCNALFGGSSDAAADLEEAKMAARNALSSTLLTPEPDLSPEDLEEARRQARVALGTMLIGEQNDLATAKQRTQEAIASVLLSADELDGTENAKSRARNALELALAGEVEDGNIEDAKTMAREALAASLVQGAQTNDDLDKSRSAAREAMASALMQQASSPKNASSDADELARVQEKKKELTATREELGKINQALKSEVSDLNQTYERLQLEHTSLREKMRSLSP